MNQPTKLTDFQLNRIIKRFVSSSSTLPLLASPFETSTTQLLRMHMSHCFYLIVSQLTQSLMNMNQMES